MIVAMAMPLIEKTGMLLAQSTPTEFDVDTFSGELRAIPGVEGMHNLRVWRLYEERTVASVHVALSEETSCTASLPAIGRHFMTHGVIDLTVEACLDETRCRSKENPEE